MANQIIQGVILQAGNADAAVSSTSALHLLRIGGHVIHARIRAQRLRAADNVVVAFNTFATLELGSFDIAKEPRAGRAGYHAGGCCIGIDARLQAQCQAPIDALVAECAFLNHASRTAGDFRLAPFRDCRVQGPQRLSS